MTRYALMASAAIIAFATGGCAARMNVSSHAQPGLAVSQYRTFDWGPHDALPTGDPRLDRNPFFQDYLEGAVERRLIVKGFLRESEDPDLLIHYHASVDRRIDVNRIDREHGFCYDDDCQVRVFDYEQGTLVLDIVDARTNRVIWRGWAQDTLDDLIDNQERMRQRITEAVDRMMARFPSRS